MRIIDCIPVPGSNLYSVVCFCGFPFKTTADNRGKVKCPHCKRESNIREMVNAWRATPVEKLTRLQGIAAEARTLYERWNSLPELKKNEGEGQKLAEKLNEYYAETQEIMASLEPEKENASVPPN